jgi:glycosyltransferase involved in cell wall biosynthesis
VSIVPTVIDIDRYVASPRPQRDTVTVGWIGSPSTGHYLEPVKPVIAELAGLARAVAIGARADQVAGSAFAAVPWTEESEVASLGEIDIGIMPLADTPWERGKCGYKLIQYMGLGLPVVASPVGVNNLLVDSSNGYLASTQNDWRAALRALATDRQLRLKLGSAGRERVVAEYSLQVWAPRLAALFRGIV